jgi:peptidoglycan hydrolase-like protein with peptidoglycan-binding domain
MTPRQARVALAGFFLLAVGVTSNALYLQGAAGGAPARAVDKSASGSPARAQPQRHPGSPKAPAPGVSRTSSGPAKPASKATKLAENTVKPPEEPPPEPSSKGPQTLKVRMVRVATIAAAPQEEADPDTVRAVATELNRRGYGPVPADGTMHPALRAAILAFEQEHRLALTAEASQALLKTILFGATDADTEASSEASTPHAQALIKEVQQMLAARGYRPGAIDGRLSGETVSAIRTFETDQGLVPKGRISVAVLERLRSGIAGGGPNTRR